MITHDIKSFSQCKIHVVTNISPGMERFGIVATPQMSVKVPSKETATFRTLIAPKAKRSRKVFKIIFYKIKNIIYYKI